MLRHRFIEAPTMARLLHLTSTLLLVSAFDPGKREIHVRVACPPIVAPCFFIFFRPRH